MSIPLTTIPHATSVDCAHFSPHGGNWLATVTSKDSHINMFDTSIVTRRQESDALPIPLPSPIRVYHPGFKGYEARYMRVAWDPKKRNQFVIGSMGAPPRIKIFSAHRPARELRSANFTGANTVNVFHPYMDLLASGGASGIISLWRGTCSSKQ
ncbi:hypothetical protein ON010_g14933 [Phytophthora cinnamomi]|nr:hypothetical protein ON010_g14933 [Phytophthora cinnamomi]